MNLMEEDTTEHHLDQELSSQNSSIHNRFRDFLRKFKRKADSSSVITQSPATLSSVSVTQQNEQTIFEGLLGELQPVDYGKILEDNRLLFIADNHMSFDDKEAFGEALENLVKLEITDLALEMLPKDFDTSNAQAIRAHLRANWEKKPGMSDEYFCIITKAQQLGIRVFGIDVSPATETSWFIAGRDKAFSFVARNKIWVNAIKSKLENDPRSKIVVFHGSTHTGYYPARDLVNNHLEDFGYKSKSVSYIGGDHKLGLSAVDEEKATVAVAKSRNMPSPFMVKVLPARRDRDYIIYTKPQSSDVPAPISSNSKGGRV